MIVLYFLRALILTEVVEVIAAFLLGYRGKKFLITLLLINIITNPLINCIVMILYYYKLNNFIIVLALEVLVVIGEWRLFEYALGKGKRSYLFLSIIINLSSYLIGLFLFH